MKDTIIFSSKPSISPETNVSNFIDFCRYQLNAFGKELDWESPVWKGFVTFKKVGKGNYRIKKEDIMHDDYIDFAKAYLRYQQFLKPVKNYGNIMIALRCLEMALLKVCRNAFI
ncbi:DNA-binding protein, partial [Salmonella enterica]|nr:DNA-binding protein [Salmonella enterica]